MRDAETWYLRGWLRAQPRRLVPAERGATRMSEARTERDDEAPAVTYPAVWDGHGVDGDREGGAEAMLDRLLDGDWSTS